MQVEYLDNIYEFIANYGDIHVFCRQAQYNYSDWVENGSILVTRYCGDDKFQVLLQLNVSYDGGYVSKSGLTSAEYATKR